jgi:hypothetical protein
MPDEFCSNHKDQHAVGKCSNCKKPFCLDCLDVESGRPLCVECLKKKPGEAPSAPTPSTVATPFPPASPAPVAGSSPLNFKGKGLEDDPFGLFGSSAPPSAPKIEPPKAGPLPDPKPFVPNLRPLTPAQSPAPKISAPSSMDLDDLASHSQPLKPILSATPSSPAAPQPFPMDPLSGVAVSTPKKPKLFSLAKAWVKYLVRQSYEFFDPLARKLRVPTYVFLGGVAGLVVVGILVIGSILNRPVLALVEKVPAIHLIQVSSAQISEMDVTTYSDFQNQLQTMGFAPLLQITIPQLPSPNFFDVGMKADVGTYSTILKVPGQITPRLSFVTIFNNGVWFSTDGWKADNQESDDLISEHFPGLNPDQLYVKHIEALEKLKKEKDLQVQGMGDNRYMAALTDHLRWFIVKKEVPSYRADFNLWY